MTAISVIMPVLNGGSTIERAIHSLFVQTFKDFEIIIVDDGSTDDTAEIIRGLTQNDMRVRLVSLGRNYGVSYARNTAIEMASGDWIAIVDADDWIEPFRFERMIKAAEQLGADVVIDNLKIINSSTGVVEGQSKFAFDSEPRQIFAEDIFALDTPLTYPAIGYTQPLCRRSFVEEKMIRYNENYRLGEDFVFLAELVLRGARLFALPFSGYVYQFRTNELWQDHADPTKNLRQYDQILAACEDLRARYNTTVSEQTRRAMNKRYQLFKY